MGLFDTLSGNTKRIVTTMPEDTSEIAYHKNVVSDIVQAQDSIAESNRSATWDGYTHVSSLIDFCPRRTYIQHNHKLGQLHQVKGSMRIVWAIGRAVENHIRNQIISSKPSNCYGVWVCRCKSTKSTGYGPQEIRCRKCKTKCAEYAELSCFDHDSKVVGNPDLLLLVEGKLLIIEIKSITDSDSANKSGRGFTSLAAPLGDHVFQAASYRKILKRKGFKVHDKVVVLYANKQFSFKSSAYKEFHVEISPQTDEVLNISWRKASELSRSIEQKKIPDRCSKCINVHSQQAKNCPVSATCFSL